MSITSPEEHLKRIQNPNRKLKFKSTKLEDVTDTTELIKISQPNLLKLDITSLQPADVFSKIQKWITKLST